jgi:hypothetical protein
LILIITDLKTDVHAQYVKRKLETLGKKVMAYNPTAYPFESTSTLEFNRSKCKATLNSEDIEIDISKVKSIWYRRPGDFTISNILKPEEREWLQKECIHFFNALWMNLDKPLWVSKPHNIRIASFKLFQLTIATELGFRIPHSIVTNNVKEAKSFIKQHQNCVIKSLSVPYINSNEEVAFIYTHLITKEDKRHISSIRYGPTFIQEFIPKKSDIRVTVIGKFIFAAEIESSICQESFVDFRKIESYDLPHKQIKLPNTIKNKCLKIVKQLGLQFGAIDLILTKNDEYIFLEINPNGQWLWIEEMTGMPLTNAMCNLLCHNGKI